MNRSKLRTPAFVLGLALIAAGAMLSVGAQPAEPIETPVETPIEAAEVETIAIEAAPEAGPGLGEASPFTPQPLSDPYAYCIENCMRDRDACYASCQAGGGTPQQCYNQCGPAYSQCVNAC